MSDIFLIYLLSIKRSPLFEAKLTRQILSLIGFGYLFVNLVFIGFYLDKILIDIRPQSTPMDTFSRYFLYLFAADIVLKYFRKSNKYIDVLPYLTLPIKQKKIFALLFVKELLATWNFIWIVIFTPFFLKVFYPTHNFASTALLIFSLYLLSVTVSFFIRYINVAIVQRSVLYGSIPFLTATGLGCVAYYISIAHNLLININLIFTQYGLWVFVCVVLLFLTLYTLFLQNSKRELYSHLTGHNKHVVLFKMKWFDDFGLNGEIIKFCLKEILRTQLKRNILSFVLMAVLSLMSIKANVPFLSTIFWTIVPILVLGATLGEFTFSAESIFFDKLMSTPQKAPFLILLSKYAISLFIAFLITIAFVILYLNKTSILFWVSIFFFECGVLLFFIFQNAVYNQKRFDIMGSLRKISDSNIYSLVAIVLVFVSLGIVILIETFLSETTACYFMLLTGMIFTFTSPFWLKNIYNRFLLRRYENMDGFRNT
jgi:hypothetical protein